MDDQYDAEICRGQSGAGQHYYFEMLHKEWGGFDHWSVGWTTPASNQITIIGANNLEPWGATATLPATNILGNVSIGHDRVLLSPEILARAAGLVAQGGQFST